MQPQQLDSVDKDEDPVYGPVGRARGKIDRALTGDTEISPDLAQMLNCEFELKWRRRTGVECEVHRL
jgi:nuclear pore complex protein Nup155